MPSRLGWNILWLTAALSTTTVFAHPLFNGHIVARADELLAAYDYLVIGGGASGLTVANRLSEQPSTLIMP
jgi:hypothetical protein